MKTNNTNEVSFISPDLLLKEEIKANLDLLTYNIETLKQFSRIEETVYCLVRENAVNLDMAAKVASDIGRIANNLSKTLRRCQVEESK